MGDVTVAVTCPFFILSIVRPGSVDPEPLLSDAALGSGGWRRCHNVLSFCFSSTHLS